MRSVEDVMTIIGCVLVVFFVLALWIKRIVVVALVFTGLGLFSCSNLTPAGFWNDFNEELLKENTSDQGPYGGHRAMYWKAVQPGMLRGQDGMAFAAKNGWELVDSIKLESNQIESWGYDNTAYFVLDYAGFIQSKYEGKVYFPRWIQGNIKIYAYKTGWIIIEPDTGTSFDVNGFIVVNEDETEMSVYHLWGE